MGVGMLDPLYVIDAADTVRRYTESGKPAGDPDFPGFGGILRAMEWTIGALGRLISA